MTAQENFRDPDRVEGEVEPPPIPPSILRRERRFILMLACVFVVSATIGWMTIPTDEQLLERASTHGDVRARNRAMNSLVLRGYWHERPPAALAEFLKEAPPELRQFIADSHGGLLRR